MPLIQYLATDLGPDTPAAPAFALAPALPRDRFRVRVGVVGPDTGPAGEALRANGVDIHHLPLRYPGDARGFAALRSAVTGSNVDVLHALDPFTARLAYLLTRPRFGVPVPPRVVASGSDSPGTGLTGWLTRRALYTANRVIAATRAEADRYLRLGAPAGKIEVIPPGVPPAPPPPDPVAVRKALDIPSGGRLVIAAGRFDAAGGMRSAAWAFDIVRYVVPDLYLVLVGDGPERGRVERFARGVSLDDYRVRFTGARADLPAVFGLAEVAWVTHARGGLAVALSAMAAGRPVVAFATPELAEVVEDGVTGRLVPPTDPAGLAAVTNELLDDPEQSRQLAAAARERVAERFGLSEAVGRYASLYDGLVRG